MRPDEKFRQGFTGTCAAASTREPKQATGALAAPETGAGWSLKWGEGGSRSVGPVGGVTCMVCLPPWSAYPGISQGEGFSLPFSHCSSFAPTAHARSYF